MAIFLKEKAWFLLRHKHKHKQMGNGYEDYPLQHKHEHISMRRMDNYISFETTTFIYTRKE